MAESDKTTKAGTSAKVAYPEFGSTRGRAIRAVVAATALAAVIVVASSWVADSNVERITQASQMVMQLDSFLSAGWIAGFFFFWGNFGKEMRKLRRLRYQALELPFASVQELIDYLKPNTLEKDTAQIGTEIFALLVVGVLNFVASGVLAVGSVITANGYLLVLALATLVGGTIVLFETWYIVHYVSEIVGVLYDKLSAISKSAKES